MAASYPAAVKTFSAVVNGVTKLVAALFNSPYDEITAIETELGVDPAGVHSDVVTRLNGYDSGWFAVAVNTDYQKDHNLGTTKVLIAVYFNANSDGSGAVTINVFGANIASVAAGVESCCQLQALSTTQLTVHTGYDAVAHKVNTGNDDFTAYTSGYYRILVFPMA